MTDFADIAIEFNKLKQEKELLDGVAIKTNEVQGESADSQAKLQKFLPTPEAHYKKQEELTKMFDTTARAGARSTLSSLFLPGGRKNFSEFHDKYTGTGRIKRANNDNIPVSKENAPQLEVRKPSVVFITHCLDCWEPIDENNFVFNLYFIPSGDKLPPDELAKWQAVDLKPGMVICNLFCAECPKQMAKRYAEIKNDPFKSAFMVIGIDGKPISLAEKEASEFSQKYGQRLFNQRIDAIKRERDNPDSDVFYGDAII